MIIELLDKQVAKEQEESSKKPRSGYFNPSSMGRCYRYIYWNRKNEPISNPIPLKTLKTFRAGNIYHRDLQSLIPKEQVEIEYRLEDFHMFVDWDCLSANMVADFKTINQWGWKLMCGSGFDIKKDKLNSILQVMVECWLLKRQAGMLIFVNKDTYEIKEFMFQLSDWEKTITDELDIMRSQWSEQKLPKGDARCYGGKECNYCSYKDKCNEIGKDG